jgi:hypothetical protein
MERFFDGTNQEISEIQGGMGKIRKIQKKQEGKNGENNKMRSLIYVHGDSHNHVFSMGWEHPWAYCPHAILPQENPLVWEPPLQHKILLTSRQDHPNLFFNKKVSVSLCE